MALAAIAARTRRIRLGSAVTVLSSDDPIRIFERFSTLDAISQGRAEVILGRGSFIESFPLFGFDLGQYEELFEQKLDLYSAVTSNRIVDWQGNWRPPLKGQEIFPLIEKGLLKTWIGVGGTPASVVRAVRYDMHLMLAIIGGDPQRFRSYVDLYQKLVAESGRVARDVGVHFRAMSQKLMRRLARSFSAFQENPRSSRPGARVAASDRGGFRARNRVRLTLCGLSRYSCTQDR